MANLRPRPDFFIIRARQGTRIVFSPIRLYVNHEMFRLVWIRIGLVILRKRYHRKQLPRTRRDRFTTKHRTKGPAKLYLAGERGRLFLEGNGVVVSEHVIRLAAMPLGVSDGDQLYDSRTAECIRFRI